MKETRSYFTTPSNYTDHTRFGGVILPSDFCTDYKGTRNIASRIASDWNFDEQCRTSAFGKERTFWTDGYFICSVGNVSENN